MKINRFQWLLIPLLILVMSCSIPISRATPTPSPSQTPEKPPSQPTQLPSEAPALVPTILPTGSPNMAVGDPVFGVRFQTVPLGSSETFESDGKKFALKVNETFQGEAAIEKMFNQKPREGMQWALVQLSITYLEGPKDERVMQPFQAGNFDIISQGHMLNETFLDEAYTPSPWLTEIKLLPGETSLTWLSFSVYAGDLHPIMRLEFGGQTHDFALLDKTQEVLQAEPGTDPSAGVLSAGLDGLGTQQKPIPFNQTVSYTSTLDAGQLYLTIEKSVRGYAASKRISSFGLNAPAPEGMEYVLAYVTLRSVGAPSDRVTIDPSNFALLSNGIWNESPRLAFCEAPCFGPMTIFTGGKASGWLPLLVKIGDPDPLLVFESRLNMTLISDADKNSADLGGFAGNAIRVETLKNVKAIREMKQNTPVFALAFSPDGNLLASGSDDRKIHIWQVSDGSEVTAFQAHQTAVKDLSFSSDGSRLASVGYNDEITLWDTGAWQPVITLRQKGKGMFARFLSDQFLMTATIEGILTLWDTESGEIVETYKVPRMMNPACVSASLQAVDVSPDGQKFVAALSCGYAAAWTAESSQPLVVDYNNAADQDQAPYTSAVAISAVGDMAVYGSSYYQGAGYMLDVINLEKGLIQASVGSATLNIPVASFSPNGEVMVAAVAGTVRAWFAQDYRWIKGNVVSLDAHSVQVTSIEFSRDAAWMASGDYNGKIVLWGVEE